MVSTFLLYDNGLQLLKCLHLNTDQTCFPPSQTSNRYHGSMACPK
jgi:hypothetical protein